MRSIVISHDEGLQQGLSFALRSANIETETLARWLDTDQLPSADIVLVDVRGDQEGWRFNLVKQLADQAGRIESIWIIVDPKSEHLGSRYALTDIDGILSTTLPYSNWIPAIVSSATQRRVVDQLQAECQLLSKIIKSTVEGILVCSEDGRITFCNPAIEVLFGYSAQDLLGQSVDLLVTGINGNQHRNYIDGYLSGRPSQVIGAGRPVVGRSRSQESIPLHLSVAHTHHRGNHFFVAVLTRLSSSDEGLAYAAPGKLSEPIAPLN